MCSRNLFKEAKKRGKGKGTKWNRLAMQLSPFLSTGRRQPDGGEFWWDFRWKKATFFFVQLQYYSITSWIFVDWQVAIGCNKELSTTKQTFDSSPSVTAPRVFSPAKSFPASLCCGRHSWTFWACNCARQTNPQFFSAVPDQFWNKLGTW